MGKLTRRDAEARRAAVLKAWVDRPDATGDEIQKLLVDGKLTGVKGPAMSIGTLYALRKQAADQARIGRELMAPKEVSAQAMTALRKAAQALQVVLAQLPGVREVVVTRDSSRLVRVVSKEETF